MNWGKPRRTSVWIVGFSAETWTGTPPPPEYKPEALPFESSCSVLCYVLKHKYLWHSNLATQTNLSKPLITLTSSEILKFSPIPVLINLKLLNKGHPACVIRLYKLGKTRLMYPQKDSIKINEFWSLLHYQTLFLLPQESAEYYEQ
jgi:hypothetical protein